MPAPPGQGPHHQQQRPNLQLQAGGPFRQGPIPNQQQQQGQFPAGPFAIRPPFNSQPPPPPGFRGRRPPQPQFDEEGPTEEGPVQQFQQGRLPPGNNRRNGPGQQQRPNKNRRRRPGQGGAGPNRRRRPQQQDPQGELAEEEFIDRADVLDEEKVFVPPVSY